MAGKHRIHSITHSIRGLTQGDTVLIGKPRSSYCVEVRIVRINKSVIVCRMGRKHIAFNRVDGIGLGDNDFNILACGAVDIDKYRQTFADRRGGRKSLLQKLDNAIGEEAPLPVSPELKDTATLVAKRILLHMLAGQFDACIDIVNAARVQHNAHVTAMRDAVASGGVGHSIALLGVNQKWVNALNDNGLHTIAQLCGIDRNYLLDYVPQFGENALNACIDRLEFYGFKHRLTEEAMPRFDEYGQEIDPEPVEAA